MQLLSRLLRAAAQVPRKLQRAHWRRVHSPTHSPRASWKAPLRSFGIAPAAVATITAAALAASAAASLEGEPQGALLGATVRAQARTDLPEAFVREAGILKSALRNDQLISFDADDRGGFTQDASFHRADAPYAVARPQSAEQVRALVALCYEHGVPIVPYGGGTSLEGHVLAFHGGVLMDMGGMNTILQVRAEDMDATVQPGVRWEELNAHLKPLGLFFPPDPGPGATIGGMVSTRCSGPNAARYGTMRENVLSLEAVLASSSDAPLVKTGQRARKSSAGYDLTRLFVGAEGTLGLVTSVTVKLQRIPEKTSVGVYTFPSIRHAALGVQMLLGGGTQVSRCELLDDEMARVLIGSANRPLPPASSASGAVLSRSVPDLLRDGTQGFATPAILLVEFAGTERAVVEQQEAVERATLAHEGRLVATGRTDEESKALWQARKDCLLACQAAAPDKSMLITDVCVPLSRFADCIGETKDDVLASSPRLLAPVVAHAGDGNFHLFLMFDRSSPEEAREAERIKRRVVERALAMEGTCTGEHGVGVGKKQFLAAELGNNAVETMRLIKGALDPRNIMNPGKVLDM